MKFKPWSEIGNYNLTCKTNCFSLGEYGLPPQYPEHIMIDPSQYPHQMSSARYGMALSLESSLAALQESCSSQESTDLDHSG